VEAMRRPEPPPEEDDGAVDWVKLIREKNAQADAVLKKIQNRSTRNIKLSDIHIDVVGQGQRQGEEVNIYVDPGEEVKN
jgi:hypothetical protein